MKQLLHYSSLPLKRLFVHCVMATVTLFLTKMSTAVTASRFLSRTAPGATARSSACCFMYPKNPRQQQNQQQRIFLSSSVLLRVAPTPIDFLEDEAAIYGDSGYKRPTVNWYPGHIAKAERQLAETLKAVDVVVEVRDARACKATSHPMVGEWCAGRPRIVVLTHLDAIPKLSYQQWKRSYEEFGAEKWDGEVSRQVLNQAVQNKNQRFKYDNNDVGATAASQKKKKKDKRQRKVVSPVESVLFVDAKQGQGFHAVHRTIFKAGMHVQERRERRGLKNRPLRVGIIGYPNVGKSALINRILGRKRAKSADTPGVTRSLQWIRVRTDDSKTNKKKEFELLDSPGIIPANIDDQSDALLLAACNCIGQGAYDNQAVAAYLCEWVKTLHLMKKGDVAAPQFRKKCLLRYGFDPAKPLVNKDKNGNDVYRSGEDMVFQVADNCCKGDPEDAARKILQDFRQGRLGPVSLQLAPQDVTDEGAQKVPVQREVAATAGLVSTEDLNAAKEAREREQDRERKKRAKAAMGRAKEQGLKLPPMMMEGNKTQQEKDKNSDEDEVIGKGLFDGW